MVAAGGEFAVQPEGADVRSILITHAMSHKSGVRNGHKILRDFAARLTTGERIFADCPPGLKPNVLKDNRITQNGPPFLKN